MFEVGELVKIQRGTWIIGVGDKEGFHLKKTTIVVCLEITSFNKIKFFYDSKIFSVSDYCVFKINSEEPKENTPITLKNRTSAIRNKDYFYEVQAELKNQPNPIEFFDNYNRKNSIWLEPGVVYS